MKIRDSLFSVALVASLFSFAYAAEDAAKTDVARLQGEWVMVSGAADGVPLPEVYRQAAKRVCTGDETKVTINTQLILHAKFAVDPAKLPRTIDYAAIAGPTEGRKHFGIYEFDGDTVKFCFGEPDAARPTDFTTKPGDRRTSTVWKRQAPTEKK
jgi:uncharacterized protein (TIGR03067 family)